MEEDVHEQAKQAESIIWQGDEGTENCLQLTRYSGKLDTEMEELTKTRAEIKKAREHVMQSWLDSKPLIDQLEKQQLDLKHVKSRASMATVVISEFETQLETVTASLKSSQENEIKERTLADELSRSLEKLREEMENLKVETVQERRERTRMKQELRLRRQTLRTLQLTLRAVRIESDAIGASTVDALHNISQSSADEEATVQLSHEEYHALARRAREEAGLADWRVSVSMEQRQVAEASRDEASRRLKDLYTGNRSRKGSIDDDNIVELRQRDINDEIEYEDLGLEKQDYGNITTLQAVMAPDNVRRPSQRIRRSRSNNKRKMVKKKKSSILQQIKSFFVRMFRTKVA